MNSKQTHLYVLHIVLYTIHTTFVFLKGQTNEKINVDIYAMDKRFVVPSVRTYFPFAHLTFSHFDFKGTACQFFKIVFGHGAGFFKLSGS